MKSYKAEVTRQLEIRKQTLQGSLKFAELRMKAYKNDVPTPASKHEIEFKNQVEYCTEELKKIKSCITFINALPS